MSQRDESKTPEPDDLEELVEGLRSGETRASEQVRQRVRRIVAFRGFGMRTEDRLDLEQLVMTQVWQAVSAPTFDCTGFWGFVEVVVARRCIDWLRSSRPSVGLDELDLLPDVRRDPLRDVLSEERASLARQAVDSLPENCRQLIRLHHGDDKSYAEIAELLGRSEGALRVQMHRCIRRAAEELKKLVADGNVHKDM